MTAPDRAVRARTRAGRLDALNRWLQLHEAWLWVHAEPANVVDVGFGETPVTTLELAETLHGNTNLQIVGVERDAARVAAAQTSSRLHLSFREGGFDSLGEFVPAVLVRALNVLRAYPEPEAAAAIDLLAAPLVDGGLLIEGTTDTEGHLMCVHVFRKGAAQLRYDGLLFFTDGSRGFAPMMFRDWLPRDLRRRVTSGSLIREFLERWSAEAAQRETGQTPRQVFASSAVSLAARYAGYALSTDHVSEGFLYLQADLRPGSAS